MGKVADSVDTSGGYPDRRDSLADQRRHDPRRPAPVLTLQGVIDTEEVSGGDRGGGSHHVIGDTASEDPVVLGRIVSIQDSRIFEAASGLAEDLGDHGRKVDRGVVQ